MKKFSFIVFVLSILTVSVFAQQKPLLVINGDNITAEEFMAVFMKNSTNKSATKEEIDDYLELYINFRLKVAEAKFLQLDTQQTFKQELEGYRRTLAQPYLTKTEILDKLVFEAYERMQWDLRAGHILIKTSPFAAPADTLKAYRKAVSIRNRVIKGEDFFKVAVETSEDESARGREGTQGVQGNRGDLGYFSALDLVYDFENEAYGLKVGEVSMPVRSEFGYHIIYLTEKKPSLGRVQTAHILFSLPPDANEETKTATLERATDIYDKIMSGESFEEMAKEFSDDKGSGMRGGSLPWFGVFRMIPEFIEPLYNMQKGDITKPILTSYGYHIVKLIDIKAVGEFDQTKSDLKTRIMRDGRYEQATASFVEKLKTENGFTEFPNALKQFIGAVNDSIYKGSWKAEWVKFNNPLFITGDKTVYQGEFALFVEFHQPIAPEDNKEMYLKKLYDSFVQEAVIGYENENLEKKYPAFNSLMQEYHDGILLFDLTDRMVWSKALRDTAGLNAFYETVKHNYMWTERVEGTIYYFEDQSFAKTFHKEITKAKKKGIDIDIIYEQYNTIEDPQIPTESGIFIKVDHPVFSNIKSEGISKPFEFNNKYIIVQTDRIIQPEPKALREVKGVVTNEYQNYLEKEWIAELRKKYTWSVNKDVLQTLYR